MAKKYTLDELLIITVAREIKDGDNVILGVGLPTTAGAMAKALHAPNATLMMESGIIDIEPLVPPNHIADANSCRGFSYATDLFSMFTMTYRGFVNVCFLGVAQIDRYGNINTTVIGDYFKPKMRLAGAGGAPDFMAYSKHTILTMRGGEFVEKLSQQALPRACWHPFDIQWPRINSRLYFQRPPLDQTVKFPRLASRFDYHYNNVTIMPA